MKRIALVQGFCYFKSFALYLYTFGLYGSFTHIFKWSFDNICNCSFHIGYLLMRAKHKVLKLGYHGNPKTQT